MDLENLSGPDLRAFADSVIQSWSQRDRIVNEMALIRDQQWDIDVPKGFKNTAQQVHNSISREIPSRVAGLLAMRHPLYSRLSPSDDMAINDNVNTVERYFQAADAYYAGHSLGGTDAYEFAMDQLVSAGAVCVGSIFAPHAWASIPPLLDAGGEIVKDLWRDSEGKPTTKKSKVDNERTAIYYKNVVQAYRQSAAPPIQRRYMETRQCYPLFLLNRMQAMFIKRQVTLLELQMFGFDTSNLGEDITRMENKYDLLECWLPNRVRYFVQHAGTELQHARYPGQNGIPTNYGFVPYSYQSGIKGGSLGPDKLGMPVLWLVASQIKLLDTLDTFALNAVYLASFPTFKFRYNDRAKAVEVFTDRGGKDVVHYEIHTGEINDFGEDRELVPLENPGMNADFYRLRDAVEAQIDKIIPRALRGEAESSGYNTLQVTAQAKAIFNSLFTAAERTAENLAQMEMRLIDRFIPEGQPIYLEYAEQTAGSIKAKLSRIKMGPEHIQHYYSITASVDRELDHITEGSWRAKMNSQGYGSVQWVEEGAGIPDSNDMERQRARDRVLKSPAFQQILDEDAARQFGLLRKQRQMAMMAKIKPGANGMPLVQMDDGNWFGPGQTPQMQGDVGAMLGGLNLQAAPGSPNLSTVGNPEAMLPSAEGQPAAFRQGGGAIPGAMQLQNLTRPEPNIPM